MKVCYFYVYWSDREDRDQRRMAEKSIASVRRHMPQAEIWHLTNETTKIFDGADEELRRPWSKDWFTHSRADTQGELDGDCLFLDTDTILVRSVEDVFKYRFDVAVAEKAEEGDTYNQGVVFSRTPGFWKAVARKAREKQVYDEVGFTEVLESGEFKVQELAHGYNFAPCHDLAVLHFKGQRKKAMRGL